MILNSVDLPLKSGELEVLVPIGTKFSPPILRYYGNISHGSHRIVVAYLTKPNSVNEIKKTLVVREASQSFNILDGIPSSKWESLGVVQGTKVGTMYIVLVIDN